MSYHWSERSHIVPRHDSFKREFGFVEYFSVKMVVGNIKQNNIRTIYYIKKHIPENSN